jgi:hypothetical protein
LLEQFLALYAKMVEGLVIGGLRSLAVPSEVEAKFIAN